MSDNKELNDNLQRLFSTIKDAYGISTMIKDIKEKEVGNKDYEIISLNDNGHILFLVHGGYSQGRYYPIYTLEQLIKLGAKIHSVKRLSDNEVFSIGDILHDGCIETVITSISGGNYPILKGDKGSIGLDVARKMRIHLFITEDLVPIYEGDKYWYLSTRNGSDEWTPFKCHSACKEHSYEKATFSTEDKARDWVYHNKPCLSYNDAVHWLASDGSGYGLYEIVKEKINKNI